MNINDYFDPVSLEKPSFSLLKEENTFGRSIKIHTPDTPVKNLEKFDIAILGIKEDQKAYIKGSAEAPDRIREKLYLLGYVNKKIKIVDLGNLKITGNINDTYYALRDVLNELAENNIIALVLGGSQDLTYGLTLAYENHKTYWNLSTIDSKIDFGWGKEEISSKNYLDKVFELNSSSRLNYINIGRQVYFTPTNLIDKLENLGHESISLGLARANLQTMEPVLRDTHILSIDMSAVRQADAPGASLPTPNGFFGHELCQLTRYAGASDNLKAIGFFEINSLLDINNHTAHLAAQAAWYFIDGFTLKTTENPRVAGSKKYIVDASPAEQMVFLKSLTSDRWWMELPVEDSVNGGNYLISCSYEDYLLACNNEIPDRWWRRMRKFS